MTTISSCKSTTNFEMSSREFERIRQMAYSFCGVDLKGKQILVSARLGKKIRSLKMPSFAYYCDQVENDASGVLFTEMIDALTTNHTSFFREIRHFEFLRNMVLTEMSRQSKINIWSAACSTGEEPYSIAFSVIDALGEEAYSKLSLTATDISTRVLEKAQAAVYPLESIESLSSEMRRGCLMRGTGSYANKCIVKAPIKKLVHFQQWNLLQCYPSVAPFDIIFCRNVMIYFNLETQQTVIDNLVVRLRPGGYLLIGHAESLNGIKHPLEYICSATYRKPSGNATERFGHKAIIHTGAK